MMCNILWPLLISRCVGGVRENGRSDLKEDDIPYIQMLIWILANGQAADSHLGVNAVAISVVGMTLGGGRTRN